MLLAGEHWAESQLSSVHVHCTKLTLPFVDRYLPVSLQMSQENCSVDTLLGDGNILVVHAVPTGILV